jgi:L-rhamnose mutarotase
MKQYRCFALDLIDGDAAIAEYERLHKPGAVWPEVVTDLRQRGYRQLSIWRTANRLFMIADIGEPGPVATDSAASNDRLQQWDQLTKTLQHALPGNDPTPHWTEMRCIFDLCDH